MYKLSLILFSLLSILGTLHAQDGDDELVNLDSIFPIDPAILQHASDTCHAPIIEVLSIIQYEGYAKAFLAFKTGSMPAQEATLSYRIEGTSGNFTNATVQNNKVLLEGLQPDQRYVVRAVNNCGSFIDAYIIDTKTKPEGMIVLSERFYNAITKYVRNSEGVPFPEFIENLNGINSYEKISFLQQFFFGGQAFQVDEGLVLPAVPDGDTGDCFCNFISMYGLAQPATLNPATGTMTEYSQPGGGIKESLEGAANTRTWHYINNKGASKWHHLWTEGFKSKKGQDFQKSMDWTDETITSFQQSRMRITFVCMDGDRLPKECECEKDVKFWYRYDNRVSVKAEVLNGTTGSKNAIAEGEDLALITYREESDPVGFENLGMVLTRASVHCDRTPNPSFWTNIATLLSSAATLTLAVVGATQGSDSIYSQAEITQISNGIQQYFNNWATVINTPFYNDTNCLNYSFRVGSYEGNTQKTIKPNIPVELAINSFDKLYAGGRRAWRSWSAVNSDCHITALLKPNAFDGTPRHCCSPMIGAWVLSSCDGMLTTEMLKVEVAFKLGELGINPYPGVPTEFGILVRPSTLEECNKIVINPGTGHRDDNNAGFSLAEDAFQAFTSLSIWNISGSLIAEFHASELKTETDLKQLVETRLRDITPGIYFVRFVTKGRSTTQKIIVQ